MHKLYFIVNFLLSSASLMAQTNYVATTANASSPGEYNTFVGVAAGLGSQTGSYNTFIGYMSGYFNRSGSNNAFVGYLAGNNNSSGSNNAYLGYAAGVRNITGANNTYIGALSGTSGIHSSLNTFVGASTGLNNTGDGNTFVGNQAGQNNQAGAFNVFVGSQAGYANTSGQGNMFLGQQAGGANTTGNYNLFVGNSSGSNTTTGLGNTAIGDGSLLRNNTGTRNTAIGQYAGVESRNDENVFIGFAADVTPSTPNLTNAVAIGARARVSQSNSIVLGANANVGIGTSAPQAKLHITSGTAGQSGLRLENLTSASTATVLNTNKFLSVDGSGNVILASTNGSGRLAAEDGLWKTEGDNLLNTNAGGVVIGPGVSKTPAGYRLYVADGVLTEKVKVAVKSTNDWSDRVFEAGYRLRGLSEVERYISQQKHLPGVPSAEEVVKEGVDVGQMQAKLLEKVEELTLYVIELKKQNDALKQKSSQLERRVNKLQSKVRK